MEWGLFLIAGCIAGAMSGLLGIGGGTIIVPALSMIFTKQANIPDGVVMHMASGTALCIMIFTSASSTFTHFKHGSRAWLYFRRVVLYIIIGIVLGALVADFLPTYMMKKVQEVQETMKKMQEDLARLEVEGTAAAGLVKVTMTGRNDVRKLEIDDSLLSEDKAILEDLIAAAVNDAVRRVEEAKNEKMSGLTAGMNIPPGFKMPF